MRVLLAPDKFKGTFSAAEVCRHLRDGLLEADPSAEVVSRPLADGGEGTLDVLLAAAGGTRVEVASSGPLGDPLRAPVGRLDGGAVVVESALFCGLGLVRPDRRDPMRATTLGLGAAIREALSWRPPELLVGLGGSATVDGGLGVARGLGFEILDAQGRRLEGTPADLPRIRAVRPPPRPPVPPGCSVAALCDVPHRLLGPDGAAAVFGPQKGATEAQVRDLQAGLRHLSDVVRRDLGVSLEGVEGGGAAGGLGAGLHAFLGARLQRGAEVVAERTGLSGEIARADLVVTGEGTFDETSLTGKVVGNVLCLAASQEVPVVVVCARATVGPRIQKATILELGACGGAQELRAAGKHLAAQGFSSGFG